MLSHNRKNYSSWLSKVIFMSSLVSNTTYANPKVELNSGIAPAEKQWVSFRQTTKTNIPLTLSPQDIQDPKKLLTFLKSKPEALDPSRMTPMIAIEVGQTLMFGGELRKALTLLNSAKEKWPNNLDILKLWMNALVKSGSPSYCRKGVEVWINNNPSLTTDSYTDYLHALCIYLEGPQDAQHLLKSITILEQLLSKDPTYQGPDGVNANQLRTFIGELKGRINKK